MTTATEWLAENPGDVEALGEMLMGVEDLPIRLWTEIPRWMKEEIAAQLEATFAQPYWDDIAKTTLGDAERALEEGLREGWSIRKIAGEMRESLGGDRYAKVRSLNIARTEAGNALNGARKASLDRLQAEVGDSVPMRQTWLSVLGNTTRDTHASLDGVPADKDGMWKLAGIRIPWPSHFWLPAKERCSCQCTLIVDFGIEESTARELIQAYYDRDESNIEGKSIKHLPGQHDQSTHGHPGSGDDMLLESQDQAREDWKKMSDERVSLTEQEKSALRVYSSQAYVGINKSLRKGKTPPELGPIHSAIDKQDSLDGLRVFRGLRFKKELEMNAFLDSLKACKESGSPFEHKGLVSTSMVPGHAISMTRHSVLMEIKADKGIAMGGISGQPQELEVLLKHGSKFSVESVEERKLRYEDPVDASFKSKTVWIAKVKQL